MKEAVKELALNFLAVTVVAATAVAIAALGGGL